MNDLQPQYILIAAVTLDGKIAESQTGGSNWTSPEDKRLLRQQLDQCDVIVVGRTTYELAQKPLSKRNCIVFTGKVQKPQREAENLWHFNPQTTDIETFIAEHGYLRVAILGGQQIYNYFLAKNLINEIYLTIEPIVFGQGLNLFGTALSQPAKFGLLEQRLLNKSGTVLLHYQNSKLDKISETA